LNCGQRYAKVLGLKGYYGVTDEENAVEVIRHARDEGCSFIKE
jgi:hypothetical protein